MKTQLEINRATLERLIAGAQARAKGALDAYTHARIVRDAAAEKRALKDLDRAHSDYMILDYQLRNLNAGA